jgi:mutator protein MutT
LIYEGEPADCFGHARLIHVNHVAVAIIRKGGTILIARRTGDGPLKGKWEFPGGKVEKGETPEDCARREVREELGITINIETLICTSEHTYPHTSVVLSAYTASFVSGEISGNEYEEIRWVRPSDLVLYDFPEANGPILQRLAREGG